MGGAWCWCMACAWMYGGGDVGGVVWGWDECEMVVLDLGFIGWGECWPWVVFHSGFLV